MAKARDLAALAGLAGLAYAMRKKDKDESTTDTGDETDRLKARKPAEEGPRRQITDYMAKAPLDGTEMYPSGVMGGAAQPTATVKTMPKPVSTTQTPTVSDRRDMESGMSRGTRPVDPRNLEAGMSRGTRYKQPTLMKKGGSIKKMASGGMTASRRADGIATKGKTRGKIC
jgi:hypothetical protein